MNCGSANEDFQLELGKSEELNVISEYKLCKLLNDI